MHLGCYWTKWCSAALAAGLVAMALSWGWHHARDVEYKAQEFDCVRKRIRPLFWEWGRSRGSGFERLTTLSNGFSSSSCNYLTCMLNRTRLLTKQMGREGITAILPTTGTRKDIGFDWIDWIERDWPNIAGSWDRTGSGVVSWKEFNVWDGMSDDSDVEVWMKEPFGCYWIPLDESANHVLEYYTFSDAREGETGVGRLSRRMRFCAKAWCVTYPREVWRWMTGRKLPVPTENSSLNRAVEPSGIHTV